KMKACGNAIMVQLLQRSPNRNCACICGTRHNRVGVVIRQGPRRTDKDQECGENKAHRKIHLEIPESTTPTIVQAEKTSRTRVCTYRANYIFHQRRGILPAANAARIAIASSPRISINRSV